MENFCFRDPNNSVVVDRLLETGHDAMYLVEQAVERIFCRIKLLHGLSMQSLDCFSLGDGCADCLRRSLKLCREWNAGRGINVRMRGLTCRRACT